MSNAVLLKMNQASMAYEEGKEVLRRIDFSVGSSENVAVIGANGAGKSSLLLSIMGLMEFTQGSFFVNGVEQTAKNKNQLYKEVGLIFQNPDDQLFMPNVGEDIAFGLRNMDVPGDEITIRIEQVLETLGISHLRGKSSIRMSGGEKRLAAIASVLVMEPSLLLFDEPSSFLDPRARRKLIHTIQKIPTAKIIATHDLDFAETLCERTILLADGEIVADGKTGDILQDDALLQRYLY